VRLLLVSSASTIVSVGSTTDVTVYLPMGRLPTSTATVAVAPAARAPTGALPATTPSRLTSSVVAPAGAVPALRTVAFTVTASLSEGEAGDHVSSVSVRSGLGAAVPMTWNSATCPPGAPVLPENLSCMSA
jgi:hypothetical protein